MSKKFSFIFSILVFAILFSFIGCTDLLAPKAQTDINLNIDLSKIIKSSRNEGGSQGASSLGDNPTIKVAIYDAKDYDKATNSTENLTLITQAQASVGRDGIARVKLSDIPVGIDAIVFAELSFTDENSTQVVYAGNSGVFKVKASDNKVSLVLKKVNNDSEPPIDDTGSGETYVVEDFILYTKDNGDETEVEGNSNDFATLTNETEYTNVTVENTEMSDSVWTYFVKPNNNNRFVDDGNYKVSVELKTKSDATTVVGIAAARADYFFTVNDTWTPCKFETGYVKGSTDHDFTIGLGLSSEIQIRNLKIEKLSEIDTTEPSLVFDISKNSIKTYLGKTDKAKKIIDVSKLEGKAGYNITINTPMCHSTGTDDSYIQDVKLHLRSYATENTGANRVSFKVDNLGANTFYTSVMADTASDKSTAWNNGTNPITLENFGFYEIDFPNYVQNDELNVGVITSSKEAITEPIKLKISEFAVTKGFSDDFPPFANKFFAIQVGETWTQEKSVEVTIPVNDYKEFDVGMFNGWNGNMPSSFDDVTRFFYTGDTKIKDDLIYSVNNDNPNEPKFIITNDSGEDKIVKITLNEKYEVVIEDVSSIVTTWADLKYRIDNTSISEIVIKNDLIATERIYIGRRIVKIIADRNVIIFRAAEGEFFHIYDGAGLELGCEEYSITLDGKNDTVENKGPLIWQYQQGLGVTLTNCILQNNTLSNDYEQYERGAAIKTEQLFTMNNCSISNCHGSNGGAVYTFHNGSFTMNGGSIKNCTATENGNAVYIGSGNLTLSGDAEITSDVYLTSGTTVTVSGELNPPTESNGIVATITPSEYTVGTQILSADGVDLAQQVDKFTLSNEEYCIDSNGMIASAINYAEGLTCDVGSDGTVTLYISSAKGLATFSDIVNGSLESDIFVVNDSNQNSNHKFTVKTPYPSVNGTLRDSITIYDEWTPIGKYANDNTKKPYSGTFDGGGKTVTFENITHKNTAMYASGLFQMLAGTVKNLIIDGSISRTATGYIGGVVGYLDGGKIENCVNKATVSNVSTNGTGGIVGVIGNSGASVVGCVNMAKVSSNDSSVGGIIGGSTETASNISISKCINVGEISGAYTVAGIYGNLSSNQTGFTLSDCINLGNIYMTGSSGSTVYMAGIINNTPSCTVLNCLSVGLLQNNGSSVSVIIGAISSTPSGYTNCYFNNEIISSPTDQGTSGNNSKTTQDLCSLTISNLTNWSCVTDNTRYPLPALEEYLPTGSDVEQSIWDEIVAAATPEDIGGGTGGGTTSTYSIGEVYYQNNTPMGVVFEVGYDYIKIVALDDIKTSNGNYLYDGIAPSSCINEETYPAAYDENDGVINSNAFIDFVNSLASYNFNTETDLAAFYMAWSYYVEDAENPSDSSTFTWYIPSINELQTIVDDESNKISNGLSLGGGESIAVGYNYWSSTLVKISGQVYSTMGYILPTRSKERDTYEVTTDCYFRLVKKISLGD